MKLPSQAKFDRRDEQPFRGQVLAGKPFTVERLAWQTRLVGFLKTR